MNKHLTIFVAFIENLHQLALLETLGVVLFFMAMLAFFIYKVGSMEHY